MKMPELKQCLEQIGFTDVTTVLSSGNAVFDAKESEQLLEKKIELCLEKKKGKHFLTIVVSIEDLSKLISSKPFDEFNLKSRSKNVVTFCKNKPKTRLKLPFTQEGATILKIKGRQIFTSYVPNKKGPVFMTLLEKNFGRDISTRTFETVKKVAKKP